MDRTFKPQAADDAHDVGEFVMQSVSERDEWSRVFPVEVPATHRLVHEWFPGRTHPDPTTGADAMVLRVRMVPKDEAAGAKPVGSDGKGDTVPPGTDELAKLLNAMTRPDLVTKAAELGVAVAEKATKAVIVSSILEHHRRELARRAAADQD